MVRLLCSEIWVFAFVGWRYVPSPPVLSRVNNNVMLIICHTVQHKIDFYLWNFKSTIRRMCLFMFWCWACHKTESTDLPFEYEHVCHGVTTTVSVVSPDCCGTSLVNIPPDQSPSDSPGTRSGPIRARIRTRDQSQAPDPAHCSQENRSVLLASSTALIVNHFQEKVLIISFLSLE